MSARPTSGDPAELDLLLARLADGDRSVFPQVFARLWPPIRRLCSSLLRNEADAADAAQEALQKILERAPADYDRSRAALPWALVRRRIKIKGSPKHLLFFARCFPT